MFSVSLKFHTQGSLELAMDKLLIWENWSIKPLVKHQHITSEKSAHRPRRLSCNRELLGAAQEASSMKDLSVILGLCVEPMAESH